MVTIASPTSACARHQGGAEIHAEHRGVDRVPDEAIRPAAHELVADLLGDARTPLFTELAACPDRDESESHLERDAERDKEPRFGQPARREPGQAKEQHQQRAVEENLVKLSRGGGLSKSAAASSRPRQ